MQGFIVQNCKDNGQPLIVNMIFYQLFDIRLIHIVEGAKVSPTSLGNPVLRLPAQSTRSSSVVQYNLQAHLFRQNLIDL